MSFVLPSVCIEFAPSYLMCSRCYCTTQHSLELQNINELSKKHSVVKIFYFSKITVEDLDLKNCKFKKSMTHNIFVSLEMSDIIVTDKGKRKKGRKAKKRNNREKPKFLKLLPGAYLVV